MSERDWRAFAILANESDAPARTVNLERKRGGMIVISDGDPARCCPFWDDLKTTGKVDTVMDLDSFAEIAGKMPNGHPANLMEGFPIPRKLNRYLQAVTIVSIATLTMLGAMAQIRYKRFQNIEETAQKRLAELKVRLNKLIANQREILVLRSQIPNSPEVLPSGKHAALLALTSAVPDSVTLTSLVIGRSGNFEIKALIDRAIFDSESTREAFRNGGFIPDEIAGWKFDAVDSSLEVRGKYTEQKR